MRYVSSATWIALFFFGSSVFPPEARAQDTSNLSLTSYKVVSQQPITGTLANVTFSVTLVNPGPQSFGSVIGTVSSRSFNVRTVPGQDQVTFSPVPPNSQVPGGNTFSVLVDLGQPFDIASSVQWTFQTTAAPPVANAGPNQTAKVGATVMLNGSASTNPSGIGTLTYSWSFTSRPVGSIATLSFTTIVNPTFVVDVAGTYAIQLTVNNGVASSSASVLVSTNNSAPVAVAGPNQSVAVGATVTLNGSGSSDVDGDPLTFHWALVTVPAGSAATLTSANTVSTTFVADKPGQYSAQLVVNDGIFNSNPSIVKITTGNTAPVANAGPNQVVVTGTVVQLNGSGSTDVDGDPLTYQWSLMTRPTGSTAALSNPNAVNPTFTADVTGTYVAQLIVNDGKVNSAAATVTITTNAVQAPTANAGPNQTVGHGTTVTLSGNGTDPQGLPLTLKWALTSKPAGSTAALSSTTVASPAFVADRPGTFVAQLIVNNGFLDSAPSTVTITTTNTPPVANAGSNQNVRIGATVMLDGSGSSDADHDPLTYSWSFTSRPNGSNASLSAATSPSPTFNADLAGTYVIQLIVNDGFVNSNPTTVMITAAQNTAIILTPNPLSVGLNSTGTLVLTLPNAAGPSGQVVTLASFDPTIASVPSTVSVPANQTTTNVTVTGGNITGTTTIAASAPGISSGAVTVNVAALSISITLDSSTVGLGRTMNGSVTLSSPASAGGAVVSFLTNPVGVVDVQPPSVIIPAGSVSVTTPLSIAEAASPAAASAGAFTVKGMAVGSTTLVASSAGYFSGSVTVNVGLLGAITLQSGVTVGPSQSVAFPVTLVTGAPLGGITVSLSSNDTSKATVSPASVFIAQGATTPATQPQVTGVSFGSAVISASAPGFTGDSKMVQVSAGLSFASPTLTLAKNATQNLTLNLSAPAPAAGLTINTSSSDTTVATVPPAVVFAPNATSAPLPVKGIAAGTAIIHANALPTFPDITANVTVVLFGALTLPASVSAPVGQSVPLLVTLPVGAPAGGVTVTLTSSDPLKGTVTATAFIPPGATIPTTLPQVTGVNIGSTIITASAPGFSSATTTATITPGAASIQAISGGGQSARTNTAFAAPFVAKVLDASNNPVFQATVTFFAPSSGPSGSFAGGTNVVTVLTDASGLAVSPIFTANGIAGGPYTVSALVASFSATFAATNTVGPPASITATSGGGQSAQINAAYSAPLVATVKDSGGNLVSGASVTFTAPASGAGGSFAGGGATFTTTTNSSGVATSSTFTANATAGSFSVNATVGGVAIPATYPLTNTPGPPASITATSGGGQSAQINTAFANPLVATVKDSGGNPVSGVTVTFTGPASGASVGTVTAVTNASGVATATVTANGTAGGPYTVNATAPGVATPAPYGLTNTPGPAASITATSGGSQSAPINSAFANPLVATVKDSGGNPVSGLTVTFTGPASGASVATVTAVTNASGVATATATANGTAGGPYTVNATVTGLATPAAYSLTNTHGAPASISATSGAGQSAPINTAFGNPLVATVKDSGGNPVSAVTVTFTGPASGASVTTVTAVTNASGIATATVTANATAGGPYTVNATVTGVSTPAPYSLTNTAGPAASITATSGGGQSAQINTAFANPLVATVKDSGGNPVSGATVTFTGPASGASVATVTAVTNASGVATATVTANATAGGPYTVNATVTGVAAPAAYSLTNTPGPAASITATSGGGQSAQINTAFANPLVATVKDSGGNPVSGVTVTLTGPASGASVGTVTAVTNASGVATATVTANGTSGGPYTVSATAPGVATPAAYSLTNIAGPAASITSTSGGGQSAQINTGFANPLVATVKDSGGNPVSGVTVTFTGPASGASVATVTAVTNASGVATAAVTANATAGGPYAVNATVTGVATPAAYSLTNTPGPAASITATNGGGQSGQINTAFANPLVATVKDSGGNPVTGVTVTFTGPSSGASVATATAVTNASGVATATVTANATAGGPYTVNATAPGVATPAAYSLTNTPGPAASITATSGGGQSAQVNAAFANPLVATVKDAGGNPVSGATVTFTGPASGASVATVTAVTNASGVATATVTANATAGGPYTVNATAPGVATPAPYSLTNTAGPAASISATSGGGQSAQINAAFANPLVATVKDAGGNPKAGVTVTFTGPGSGASVATVTAVTNAAGVATATVTANSTAGGPYTVSASVSGVGTPANYSLTNMPGPAASITATSGGSQSAQINTTFANPLVAMVKDAGGNPVSGVTVTFTGPASGASVGTVTAITNASGVATAAVTANGATGPYTVSATVPGVVTPATYSLTNTAGAPASISATSGGGQSTQVNTQFAAPLVATVKDSGANPVSGVTVTFTGPANGASVGTMTAVTNASGVATAAVTANGTAGGPYTVSATAPGATSANYSLTNTPGPPASITANSGGGQSAQINTAFAIPLMATVKDSGGNPVSGVTVTFTGPGVGASVASVTATTNAAGVATANVTANATAGGPYTVSAAVGGVATPANFSLTNTPGPAASITATSGGGQTAQINTAFANPLVATVKDAGGNPVSGVTVSFTGPGAGASVATVTGVTNASGVATVVVIANSVAGGPYTVTATVAGASSGAFALTNLPGPAASVTATGGTGQSTVVNTAFPIPLSVVVKDAGGNPVGGASVTFSGPGSGASIFTITLVTNAAGVVAASVTANATAGGPYTVTASVVGATAATFSVTNTPVLGGGGIMVTNASVGQNLEANLTVTLPQAAPAGGTMVTLTSSDQNKLLLGSLTGLGAVSVTFAIPEGATTATGVNAQALVSSGTATVTATAPNFTSGAATITFFPSGFMLVGPNGIGVPSFSTNQGVTTPLTVVAARLDSLGNYIQNQPVRGGTTVSVTVNSSDTTVGTVLTSPVNLNGGDLSAPTQFKAVGSGSVTITAVVPAGFSLPAAGGNTLTAAVSAAGLVPGNITVGYGLEGTINVALNGAAGPGGLTVTVSSNDPSKVMFSKTATGAGMASIDVLVPAGLSRSQDFFVYGLASSGTVTYNAMASGLGAATGNVTLSLSGFVIQGPDPVGTPSFQTTSGAAPTNINILAVLLDSSRNIVATQPVAGGTSVNISVTSSNTTVGTIITSPVSISGGSAIGPTQFQPVSAGGTTLSVGTPPGFFTPASATSILANVITPGIGLPTFISIGLNLQQELSFSLGQFAPAGGVDVTLTSNSPDLRFSTTTTGVGTSSIIVHVPEGGSNGSYYAQGMAGSGTPTYTAMAPGFQTRTGSITLTPSGAVIASPLGLGFPFFQTTVPAGPSPFMVSMAQLNADNSFAQIEQVAGGKSITVNLSDSTPSVGTIASSVIIPGGSDTVQTNFTPLQTGSTNVSVASPVTNPSYKAIPITVQ